MRCELCDTELFIDHTGYMATGDNSPDTKTRLYNVPYLRCVNTNCKRCGQIIEGEKIELTGAEVGGGTNGL
ncbi:MAG: hypothetical protein RR424_08895 [Oscillospiraceae bacterium]